MAVPVTVQKATVRLRRRWLLAGAVVALAAAAAASTLVAIGDDTNTAAVKAPAARGIQNPALVGVTDPYRAMGLSSAVLRYPYHAALRFPPSPGK